MARRLRSGLTALLTTAFAACSAAGTTPTPATPVTAATAPTATTVTTATTILAATTTTLADIGAEVTVPDSPGPHPAVVLVHGGGWVAGSPASIRGLAQRLAQEGFLVVNSTYALSNRVPGYPKALDDIACAVRYAAAHPDSTGSVTVIGHSAGAHLGAVVALSPGVYGGGCGVDGAGTPERFVGLAGPYDVALVGLLAYPFLGVTPTEAPDLWEAVNPHRLLVAGSSLRFLVVHGDLDGIVAADFARRFHEDLVTVGIDSSLEILPGARHLDMIDPSVVGDLIAGWIRTRIVQESAESNILEPTRPWQ